MKLISTTEKSTKAKTVIQSGIAPQILLRRGDSTFSVVLWLAVFSLRDEMVVEKLLEEKGGSYQDGRRVEEDDE